MLGQGTGRRDRTPEAPEELIQRAVAENRAAVESDILDRALDGGIDGIISQDPLGLDRVYMQAKRYARGNVVQRPAIQGFIGALPGSQGDRGVFITTSSFSCGARQEAERVNARIVLIDGDRLAALMVRHGVGVQAESTAVTHRVDEDFFDTL